MNTQIFSNAISLEEAVKISNSRPALPFNSNPVFSKNQQYAPLVAFDPVKCFDNIYWVGSKAVGSVVIDTSDGYIMIDDGSNEIEAEHMANSFDKLGLDKSRIKLIIISHDHFDHYGGTSYFLKNVCPNAKIAISRIGWNLLQTVPTEFAFVQPRPEKADILLEDGMCLNLGNTNIYCVLTPGHSDGCMSFIYNGKYQGKDIMIGMMGGSAAWPNMPQLRMYQSSIAYFKLFTDMAECEAYSSAHQRKEVLEQVQNSWSGSCENPLMCGRKDFVEKYLNRFMSMSIKTIQSNSLENYRMPINPKTGESALEGSPIPERQ